MKLWDPPMTRPHSVTWVPARDLWVIWVRGAWLVQGEVFGSGFARSTYTLVALNTLRSLRLPVSKNGKKKASCVWLFDGSYEFSGIPDTHSRECVLPEVGKMPGCVAHLPRRAQRTSEWSLEGRYRVGGDCAAPPHCLHPLKSCPMF